MRKVKIAPSILSANFKELDTEIAKIIAAKADYLHFDVMDGHFVPNISFGLPVLKSLQGYPLVYDVHIMISNPLFYGARFVEAGADIVTFHYEALKTFEERIAVINSIKKVGGKVGMSLKPNTPVDVIFPYLPYLDLVLVMSVEPGFGGQEFMENALDKIAKLRHEIDANKYTTLIEVDGGINDLTAQKCVQSGADVLVAGSYLFGHDDIKERIEKLRNGTR